jgi:hypothetical protein
MVNKLKSLLVIAILILTTQSAYADSRVKAVQAKLLELGYQPGIADGIWGKNTETALEQFLSSKGLIFDGTIDANEFELLEIKNIRNATLSFRFNIDTSLPKDWLSEFKDIMEILQEVLPIDENFNKYVKNSTMDIYAWNSKVKNPFSEKRGMGGASISGDGRTRWMVLEINKNEFKYDSLHRYSVIVHEYFHIYQIGLSKDRMDPKWLSEGSAKVIEEMFVQQYYGRSSLESDFKSKNPSLLSNKVFTDPDLYERYETSSKETSDGFMDMNYAGSAFMLLTLVNELQKNNISEQEAFKLVFRDFWIEKAKQRNWKKAFEKTFDMSVETFYERVSEYSRKDVKKILPSKSLKIQDIFY